MKKSLHRWATAPAALALVLLAAAGCASVPQVRETKPAVGASPDLELATHLRDSLISAAQGAATVITGSEAEVVRDVAIECQTESGTRFHYSVSIPADALSDEDYMSVADLWDSQGINVTIANGSVHGSVKTEAGNPGPVDIIALTHFGARGEFPAQYVVEGFSGCVPGDPAGYDALTGQLPH